MKDTAMPIQARSQKTKEKILRSALSMYSKKGYHCTTVDEIAAEADVSTGIAYRYFRNKKDILLSAIEYAAENIVSIANIDGIDIPEDTADITSYLRAVLKGFEELHLKFRDIHEELEGLQHTDEDVRKLYNSISSQKMENVIEKLTVLLPEAVNIREKAYLSVGIMEQYCHMKMNESAVEMDYDVLREKTIDAVMCVLGITYE